MHINRIRLLRNTWTRVLDVSVLSTQHAWAPDVSLADLRHDVAALPPGIYFSCHRRSLYIAIFRYQNSVNIYVIKKNMDYIGGKIHYLCCLWTEVA